MKTIKTTTTAYEIINENASLLIIGVNNIGNELSHHTEFFINTSDGIMIYNANEMKELFDISDVVLLNIATQLNK